MDVLGEEKPSLRNHSIEIEYWWFKGAIWFQGAPLNETLYNIFHF